MSLPTPTPISVANAKKTLYLQSGSNGFGTTNGYLQNALIGSGHQGPDIMTRISMSLKSGIDSEIEWALSYLTHLSCSDGHLIKFEKAPFLGHELIKHFVKPFQLLLDRKEISQKMMLLSLDSILTLRNAAQDLGNQQWLSEITSLRKSIVEVLKFFVGWFYKDTSKSYQLQQFSDQFRECLNYLVDLAEPLSCYYIDNTKNDTLFNQFLLLATMTKDKYLLLGSLKCLTHLLIVRHSSGEKDEGQNRQQEDDVVEIAPNNCIDAIQEDQLENFVNYLLLNDNDVVVTVLEFLKQFLSSEALHPQYPKSIKNSQLYRLQKLLQLKSSKANFHTLAKQLPILLVSGLPLNDPSKLPVIPQLNLTKRSRFVGVPSTIPDLPKQLYDIVVKFPEPLRATTWLRCCYEPCSVGTKGVEGGVAPGEVTQISLWKSYEKQFEEVWQTSKTQPNPEWPSLLPAVEFIKNVNNAFPNSEAMVVNLETETPGQAPKKKFIIKGIQPRQFAVNIDVGNYEAVRRNTSDSQAQDETNLEIGHIDPGKFEHSINHLADYILSNSASLSISLNEFNQINQISLELLDYIASEVLEKSSSSDDLQGIFKLYNRHWLCDIVYANPELLEKGIVSNRWFKYLI
ncbi:uncharacterized protein PRCAT00005112001 [Priceomyces carsonii]|uniref:uncharacterized protein n=1 Tax=Priceomyces carsonii TaxID=28549 RepID=UPI002ED9CA82|nr:unnamed protein product [Priceomyces carsonii]